MQTSTIAVTFDKSHIVTIGEKLYGESLELLRELIANAYDADAANVWIDVKEDNMTIRDDGSGMSEEGLREFFHIGSQNKKQTPTSPKYKRPRVGQFGIGKFAVLTACERFRIFTQKDAYAAEAIFDKKDWGMNDDEWHVPVCKKSLNALRGDGTTVTLENLTKTFALPDIERFIRERLPLTAPHFSIILNDKRITPLYIPGRKFPVNVSTPFGWITGELILPHIIPKKNIEKGIECVVRGIVICKSVFSLDISLMDKLQGRITADFVPITSDRSRFIADTPEFAMFVSSMQKEIHHIAKEAKAFAEKKEKQKADQTLKDTLTRMRRAIRKNPDIAPPVLSPSGEIDEESARQNAMKMAQQADGNDMNAETAMHMSINNSAVSDQNQTEKEEEKKEPPPKKIRIKSLKGKDVVARKITVGGIGITCTLDHCGPEMPAAFTESGIVYLNMDNPLYKRQKDKGQDMLSFYLTYLLSQQVSLMLAEDDVRKAFRIQDRLLTDSW